MAGNMRSRWTDFLTSDGEKPDRNRDSEFVNPPATRKELMELWEAGWNCVFRALEPLSDEDLGRRRLEQTGYAPVMAAVLNGASLTCGCLVPGEIIMVLGTAIGPSPTGLEIGADGKLATTLNGTQPLINGIPVPLLYASTGQLNAIVPYEVATGGNATIQVMSEGQVSVVCLPSCADWWNGQEQTNTLEQSKSAVLHSLTWSVLPGCATMRTADHTRPLEGI